MLLLKDQTFISSQIPTEGGEGTDSRLVFLLCAWANLYIRRDPYLENVCGTVVLGASHAPVQRCEDLDKSQNFPPAPPRVLSGAVALFGLLNLLRKKSACSRN